MQKTKTNPSTTKEGNKMNVPKNLPEGITVRNGAYAYRVQWREGTKRRTMSASGFPTIKAAQVARRKALSDLDNGKAVAVSGTVADYLTQWLDTYTRSGTVKRSTARVVDGHINAHIIPHIGHIQLAKLSPAHVQKFYADLLTHGEARHKSGRGVSPKTVRNIAGTLHKALREGVKFGILQRNASDGVSLPRWERKELQRWEAYQIGDFLRHRASHDDYLYAVWRLMFAIGLRRGEVCGMRWSDVDLMGKRVTVRTTRLEMLGEVYEETPKSRAGKRTVTIDTDTVVALAQMKNAQERAADIIGGWTSEYVATELDGMPIKPEALTRRFQSASKAAGLPVIRLHDVRHSSATLQLNEGVPVHVVSGRLGHSTPSTTLNVYAAFMPSADELAADVMGDKLTALTGDACANACANLPESVALTPLQENTKANKGKA
jgi:integrase